MYEIIDDSSPTLDQEGEKVGFSPISTDECEFEHAQPCACSEKMIVDGAVGMVEMALERLSENRIVDLDDERKAAMVSNLLVVLCGNHDAQPVVNSGSLY